MVNPGMAKTGPFDPDLVRELAQLIKDTDLTEIEVEKGDLRIYVARQITTAAPPPVAAPQAIMVAPVAVAPAPAGKQPLHAGTVPSPMVGTAYRRPSPDAKPFVEVGSVV